MMDLEGLSGQPADPVLRQPAVHVEKRSCWNLSYMIPTRRGQTRANSLPSEFTIVKLSVAQTGKKLQINLEWRRETRRRYIKSQD